MHIVQLIDALSWGGAQKLILTFAEASAQATKITVIGLRPKSPDVSFTGELEALGVKVIEMDALGLFNVKRILQLVRFLRAEKVDAIHTHMIYSNIIGSLAGWLSGVPVVTTLHNEQYTVQRLHRVKMWIEKIFVNLFVARIIAVGQAVLDAHQPRFPAKPMTIVTNVSKFVPQISDSQKKRIREKLVQEPSFTILIAVGRVTPQKAYPDLLAAFSQVYKHFPDTVLLIVGRGDDEKAVRELIADMQLSRNVFMLGFRNDVPELLAASDLYINSSHWEGLPLILLEAMSAGLPVIATRVGDIPKVVIEGTGLLVPPNDPDQLAQAIISMLNDREKMKEIGEAARSHVIANYSPQQWANHLLQIYSEAIHAAA